MPRFDIDIDVEEFMDELSGRELKEVYNWLHENFDEYDINCSKLTFDEYELIKSLDNIKKNLIKITEDEMIIINNISKRL